MHHNIHSIHTHAHTNDVDTDREAEHGSLDKVLAPQLQDLLHPRLMARIQLQVWGDLLPHHPNGIIARVKGQCGQKLSRLVVEID